MAVTTLIAEGLIGRRDELSGAAVPVIEHRRDLLAVEPNSSVDGRKELRAEQPLHLRRKVVDGRGEHEALGRVELSQTGVVQLRPPQLAALGCRIAAHDRRRHRGGDGVFAVRGQHAHAALR